MSEAHYAHYALHKLKIRPSELLSMEREEKAFIYASIDTVVEAEKKAARRNKRK